MVLHRDVVVTWNGRVSVNFRGSHDHPKLVPIDNNPMTGKLYRTVPVVWRIHTNDSNTFYNPKPLAFRNRSRALIAALYVTVIVTLFPTVVKVS